MFSVVIVLTVIMVVLFIMEPFFSVRKLPNRFLTKKQTQKKELQTRREFVVQSISDLDLDSAIAKIPKKDYQRLRKSYALRLDSLSQEIDGLGKPDGESDIKRRIEAEVKIRRKSSGA